MFCTEINIEIDTKVLIRYIINITKINIKGNTKIITEINIEILTKINIGVNTEIIIEMNIKMIIDINTEVNIKKLHVHTVTPTILKTKQTNQK